MMKSSKGFLGKLFVLSGPSGTGKGTLRKGLFREVPDMVYSISCTTRPPRKKETGDKDYRFIDEEEFLKLIEKGSFLEWARVHGNYYGTLADDVDRSLLRGENVLLEIDVQGASQVKNKRPDSVTIFVMPPSLEELKKRLRMRGTEEEKTIQTRLANAEVEMKKADEFEHVIVNDSLREASRELIRIVKSYKVERGVK